MTKRSVLAAVLLSFVLAGTSAAQATEFTYQGQLQVSSAAANGSFDLEFVLFDSAFGGSQLGLTLTRTGVAVANGVFSVNLDFGSQFSGPSRFLEIRVRPSGSGAFTTLSPRQSVSSAPYSIRSLFSETAVNASNAVSSLNANNAQNSVTFSGTLAGDVTGTQSATTVARLRGREVSGTQPAGGQVLKFNATTSQWEPANDETGSGGGGGTITAVTAGTGLTGGGTTGGVTLAIANGGVGPTELASNAVTTAKIADGAVTGGKIAPGQVVRNINGLLDNVQLAAGSNITITPSGNTLTIASSGGAGNAILNQTTQQAGANFNIGGTGIANSFNAATQYEIGGSRVLNIAGTENLFVGLGAGASNSGIRNTFVGFEAGFANTTAIGNQFFGYQAGRSNTTGNNNTFVGFAGRANTTGSSNSFVGSGAGLNNTTGIQNSFFGSVSGNDNTTGSRNAFFGASAGSDNTTGEDNSFFGDRAGQLNTEGTRNAFFGARTGSGVDAGTLNTAVGFAATFLSPNLRNATAIGSCATVSQSDSLVLGSTLGFGPFNCGVVSPTNVGIGTTSPSARLHVVGTTGLVGDVGIGTTEPSAKLSIAATGDGARLLQFGTERSWVFRQLGTGAATALELAIENEANPKSFIINTTGGVGIGTTAPTATLSVNGTANKPGGGSWTVFSDARLKNIHGRFTRGLSSLMQLAPIRFEYKSGNALNLRGSGEYVGFSAQEVQRVLPEAISPSTGGYLQINADPILWTMLNAIKEQQAQIEDQKKLLSAESVEKTKLKAEISELKTVVCSMRPRAKICSPRR
jgi:hypothetical protein